MANKLIEELIIKVKQQGAKPTEKAIKGVGDALTEAKTANNAFNASLERSPKMFKKVEEAANRAAKSTSKINFGFDSNAIQRSLDDVVETLHSMLSEIQDVDTTIGKMNNNMIHSFDNLANSLGADLERVEDSLIDVRQEAGKTNDALVGVGKGAKKAGRGMANQNRQGRNQARTFADIAKFAGPLPLLYANIAANVFALSEAFRLITEGEQLNRLEEVGKIVGAQIGQPVQFTAMKMQELTGHTLNYGEALRNAAAAASYGFDSEQIEQLTMAARRASIALGVDMQDAMNRVIRGTSKLEIELLDELGITTKLTTAYERYAEKIGVSANSLNSYQQRAALVTEINAQSVEKFGDLDEMLRNGAPWETFGANMGTAFQTFLKNLAEASSGMAKFFNRWMFGEKILSEANTKAQLLGETLSKAFEQDTRAGMIGGLVQVRDLTKQYQKELEVVLATIQNPAPGEKIDDLTKRAGYLRSAITRLKVMTKEFSVGSVEDLDRADTAYRNLSSTVKGTVQSYNSSLASIRGQSASYEKLYSDIESMKKAYFELKAADPAFDSAEALKRLGFESEAALIKSERLAKRYRDTNRELAIFAKTQAEAEIQGRWSGKDPNAVRLTILKQQRELYTALLVDQRRLGANATEQAKTEAEIAKISQQELNTEIALVNEKNKRLNTQTQLTMAGQPELLIKKDLLTNERARLANLQLIRGTYLEQEQSLNRIKQLENEILATQTAQSNQMMESALGNLASFAPGIDQMTSSLNGLAMSFNNMGQSSMTATQMVSSGLTAFQGMLSYTSSQAIGAIDQQIAAEQKRDGKSKESVAKIAALEKKKVEQQKKVAKQQILISTAVAVMNAAANPWPVPAIPLMASAALAGGLAYQQASSASANLVSGATGDTKASLTLGDRSNQVDVSQSATRGELSYIRNEGGTGSLQSFTPRANGGIGTPGNSIIVGEDGPEVITPLEPVRAYSAEESAAGGKGGYTYAPQFNIDTMDARSFLERKDDIMAAWRDSAQENGMNPDKLY
ncbi:tail length tape measure protein [Vibrio phage pVp-1]|uniref:Pore-forming tail tip protein n=1 Tax=Vibrio phage pVp-1 TaxID=1150989 RepID=H6WXP4_9CAUD|nr:tail length tape measure protein [Vibrio phage pVp-1]AFB84010.1 pore-forming tail tip protein [Vibrio phage pVp-1]